MSRNKIVPFNNKAVGERGTSDLVRYDVLIAEPFKDHLLMRVRQRAGNQMTFHVAAPMEILKTDIVAGDIIVLKTEGSGMHPETRQNYMLLTYCEKMGGVQAKLGYAGQPREGFERYIVEMADQLSTKTHCFVTLSRFDDRDGDKTHVFIAPEKLHNVTLTEGTVIDVKIDWEGKPIPIPIFSDDVAYDVKDFYIVNGGPTSPRPSRKP